MNRKNLKYWILPLVCLVMLQSCFKNDEEYWDDSATIRLENTIQDYRSVLVNSEYGWVMDFYPDQTYTEGGYVYTMKFEEDGNVAVGYELANPTDTRTSMYSIEGGEGPVLTFDTYNEYMHHFASPSQQNYDGRGGDYEFVLQRRSDAGDYVKTLGRKSKNHMPMYKLTMPASDYYAAIDATEALTDNPNMVVKVGDGILALEKASGVKAFVTETEDETIMYPFVYTDQGIRFREGVGVGGVKDSVFVFSSNHDQLVGVNCPEVTIMGDNFGYYLRYVGQLNYMYSFTGYPSSELQAIYDNMVQQCSVAYPNHPINKVGLSFDASLNTYVLLVQSGARSLLYGIGLTINRDNDTFTISKLETPINNDNCNRYMANGVTAIEDLANALYGEYAYSTPSTLNYNEIDIQKGELVLNCQKVSIN